MANRDVEALVVPLQLGNKVGGDYTEIRTDGQVRRVGAAANSRAAMYTSLPGAYDTTLAVAEQYYKILGTFFGSGLSRFTVSAAGVLTYTGEGETFLLGGSSDMRCNKACELTFAVYKNGALAPGTQSHRTVTSASKNGGLSITGLIDLATNDTLEIYAKSDTANNILTVSTLRVTAWGA